MNLIKNALLTLVTLCVCYLMLMVGDWLVAKTTEGALFKNRSQINHLLNTFKINEDKVLEEQIAKGLTPFIPSEDFDHHIQLSDKMKQLNIGAIGGKPHASVFTPCDEGLGAVTFTSDRFGLRNNDTNWNNKVNSLFIGDSFTYGSCVDTPWIISENYQSLTGKNAINLGVPGNHPKHYATMAKLFIPQLLPEEVYLIFYTNDKGRFESTIYDIHVQGEAPFFADDKSELKALGTYHQLQNFALEQYMQDALPPEQAIKRNWWIKATDWLKYRSQLPSIRFLLHPSDDSLLGDSPIAIDLAQALCKKVQCQVNIVYIPSSVFWDPDERTERYRQLLEQYTQSRGLHFYDTSSVIDRQAGSTDFAPAGPHLSPQGYRKVAEMLAGKKTDLAKAALPALITP